MKKIAVVVLNYKNREQTITCVKSIQNSSYQNIQIIVVNNDNDDELSEEIGKFRGILFIQSKDNLGYSGGNNLGIKKAFEEKADYIFILNPDTTIDSKAIENLALAAERSSAGILGPKVLFDDKKTIWFAGGILDIANVLGKHRGVDERDSGQYDKEEETDYITGGMFFIKREVLEKIGLFDEKYFLYLEDSDLCLRAKRAGFKIFYAPKAVVYHKNAQSTGLGSSLQDYYITRNRLLFAAKFLPFRTRFALFREALKNIFIPSRRLALLDYLRGNFGKGSF